MIRDKHTGLPVKFMRKKPHLHVQEFLGLLTSYGIDTNNPENFGKLARTYMRDLANLYDRLETSDSINYGIIDGVELDGEEHYVLDKLMNYTVVFKIHTFLQAATDGNLDVMIMSVFKDAIRTYIANDIDDDDDFVAIDASKIAYQTRDGRIID